MACGSEKAIPRSCRNLREFAVVFVNLREIAAIFAKLCYFAFRVIRVIRGLLFGDLLLGESGEV
jgi:hypothetical protein